MADVTIRKADGRLKTVDDLTSEAIDAIVEELRTMDDSYALDLGNAYRERQRYDPLYRLNEDTINDELSGCKPWDIINMEVNTSDDYFSFDGWNISTTTDVWEDVDLEELASELLGGGPGGYRHYIPWELDVLINDYEDAIDELEDISPIREQLINLLADYTNCEADVGDLLLVISDLANNKEAFKD